MDKTTANRPRRPARMSAAPGRPPRPLEIPYIPTPLLYDHPPKPGRRLAPSRTFRVVAENARLESVHEGRGLTVDDVIALVAKDFAVSADDPADSPYDLTVYRDKTVAAVVRSLGDGKGGYRVFRPEDAPAPEAPPAPTPAPPPRRLGGPHYDHTYREARPLALSACRAAVSDWQAARDRRAEGYRRYDASGARKDSGSPEEAREWERWLNALTSFEIDAERRVAACVLMVHGRVKHPDDVARLPSEWAPVALDLDGGPIYVVAPDADDDPRPRLTVVDGQDFDSRDFGVGDWEGGPDA